MGRSFRDRWGVPVQAASEQGVALLDEAIEALAALAGDPVAGAEQAVAADDELVLGHIYRAYLSLYGTSAQGVAAADGILKRLEGAGERAGEREALHVQAARSWASGEWEAAARALERALLRNPRDLLALKVAQDLHFFLGNRPDLRDVAARVLPAWPPGAPGWGYVQGIYAFGLEENADYRQAESRARAASHHNPRDVWAVHARLAHVFEVTALTAEAASFSGRIGLTRAQSGPGCNVSGPVNVRVERAVYGADNRVLLRAAASGPAQVTIDARAGRIHEHDSPRPGCRRPPLSPPAISTTGSITRHVSSGHRACGQRTATATR